MHGSRNAVISGRNQPVEKKSGALAYLLSYTREAPRIATTDVTASVSRWPRHFVGATVRDGVVEKTVRDLSPGDGDN